MIRNRCAYVYEGHAACCGQDVELRCALSAHIVGLHHLVDDPDRPKEEHHHCVCIAVGCEPSVINAKTFADMQRDQEIFGKLNIKYGKW